MVATPAHRLAFEERLAAAGIDVGAARARGDLVALDAAGTLRRFLTGDNPDPGGFELVLGGLIREAGASGRPVRVYGEMVALLWEAGQVNAAIEVEALWNELAARLPFSLMCGYRAESVCGDDDAVALEEVCGLHSVVVGLPPAVLAGRLPPGQAAAVSRAYMRATVSPRTARHFVVETLRRWGDGELAGDAALIATELATNAVVHARSGFTVFLSRGGDTVRIAVRDDMPLPAGGPQLTPALGHGLGVVATLATAWAVDPEPAGKTVWAQLR
jgi:hypothetical protein